MIPINDGGPAFPVADTVHPSGQIQYGFNGMSLRDWFAAHALTMPIVNDCQGSSWASLIAVGAYQVADAMLAARAKKATS